MITNELFLAVLMVAGAHCMSGVVKRSDDPSPLEAVVEKHSADIQELQAKLDSLTSIVSRHVAFYAQLSHDEDNTVPAPATGPFKFGQVVLNDGNGYSASTGIFTAPYSGVYYFGLQIFFRGPQLARIDMKMNGNIISRMGLDTRSAGIDPDESDSTSVILKLNAGDRVWVESGTGLHTFVSDHHTFFIGNLLYTV